MLTTQLRLLLPVLAMTSATAADLDADLGEGDVRVVIGSAALRSRTETRGAGWDPAIGEISWEAPLVAPGDIASASARGAPELLGLAGGRLHYVYKNGLGHQPYRLVARTARTGAIEFAVDLPASRDAWLTSMTFDRDDIFLVMGQELVIVDARSGKSRAFESL